MTRGSSTTRSGSGTPPVGQRLDQVCTVGIGIESETRDVVHWHYRGHGRTAAARDLRQANLDLLARATSQFAEYFEPYTAEPLGSVEQSWTAADWIIDRVALNQHSIGDHSADGEGWGNDCDWWNHLGIEGVNQESGPAAG